MNFLYALFGLPIPPVHQTSALEVIKYSLDKVHSELRSFTYAVDDNKAYLSLVAQLNVLNTELVRRSQAESAAYEANTTR